MLGLLLPLHCAVCGRDGRALCEGCEATFPRLEKPYCSICAGPGTAFRCEWCTTMPLAVDGIKAPYLFDVVLREMVHSLKYNNLRASAPDLGRLLAVYLQDNPMPCDILMLSRSTSGRSGSEATTSRSFWPGCWARGRACRWIPRCCAVYVTLPHRFP